MATKPKVPQVIPSLVGLRQTAGYEHLYGILTGTLESPDYGAWEDAKRRLGFEVVRVGGGARVCRGTTTLNVETQPVMSGYTRDRASNHVCTGEASLQIRGTTAVTGRTIRLSMEWEVLAAKLDELLKLQEAYEAAFAQNEAEVKYACEKFEAQLIEAGALERFTSITKNLPTSFRVCDDRTFSVSLSRETRGFYYSDPVTFTLKASPENDPVICGVIIRGEQPDLAAFFRAFAPRG